MSLLKRLSQALPTSLRVSVPCDHLHCKTNCVRRTLRPLDLNTQVDPLSAIHWVSIIIWAVGFAGNVYHDEILLNIWHKAIAEGKAKELDDNKQA